MSSSLCGDWDTVWLNTPWFATGIFIIQVMSFEHSTGMQTAGFEAITPEVVTGDAPYLGGVAVNEVVDADESSIPLNGFDNGLGEISEDEIAAFMAGLEDGGYPILILS